MPGEPKRSNVSGKTLNLYYKSAPWTAAHEVGHQVFNWNDHYTDTKDGSIPKKGWEKTLMGEYGQQLSSRELECLIGVKNDC